MRCKLGPSLMAMIFVGLAAGPLEAQERSVVFVFDGSNSMWGRVGGEMKITGAKDVFGDLLGEVTSETALGLVTYGHRREGDCHDIETMAELGTPPSKIAAAVDGITPRGKTPITAALEHGADLLTGSEGPSTIVLLSDGIETCEGDPCALAERLVEQNTRLVVHTVGFDVDEDAARQLQCVADAGRGTYHLADSREALRTALFAGAGEDLPEAPAQETAETETRTVQVAVEMGTIAIDPAPWVTSPPEFWQPRAVDSGESHGRLREESLRVRPGEYRVFWRQTEHSHPTVPVSDVFSVQAGDTVTVPIATGVRIAAPEGMALPYRVHFVDRESGERFTWSAGFHSRWEPVVLPAGEYELVWHQDEHGSSPVELGTVTVEPERLNDVVVNSGFRLQPAEWIGKPYRFTLVDLESDRTLRWRGGYGKPFVPQIAPPGQYRLDYQQTEHGHGAVEWGEVRIEEGAFANIAIASGVRFIPPEDEDPPYRVYFTDLENGEESVWYAGFLGRWDPVPLPPGRYRVDWQESQRGSERITLLDELRVPPGSLVELEL